MSLDNKIINELNRYRSINKYIFEQEATPQPEGDIPPALPDETTPEIAEPTPEIAEPNLDIPSEPIDPATDPDVEKVDSTNTPTEQPVEETGTEELDITDLVTSQKNVEEKQNEYFKNLFAQLDTLQSKLTGMDQIVQKLNTLETKIEKYREKTPQEKLELRSLDSGPFNQKLSDFFVDKQEDLQKSGKNEYVLTPDDVKNFSQEEIKDTFYTEEEEDTI
jgi:hypothetical protein